MRAGVPFPADPCYNAGSERKARKEETRMFTACRPFPGITHITDAMGVSFTLIEGGDSALLLDAGYGTEDVAAYVRSLTEKPVELILSHGHHDHVLGARWFDRCFMDAADLEEFRLRTGSVQREKVKRQAEEAGVAVPEDFLTAPVPQPDSLRYSGMTGSFPCRGFDLGGLEVLALCVPGHTAGSVVLFVPSLGLLLTGDDWNPCTWMWFPCSLPVRQWRENMLSLIGQLESASGRELRHVLCSHQPAPREGAELKAFLDYMTEARLQAAEKVETGTPVDARQVVCPEKNWVLLFDAAK